MRLDTEFLKLPLQFDIDRLTQEVNQFSEADWKLHPQGFKGNYALSLISVDGDPQSDSVVGPMRPTAYLERCPYIQQVLAAFNTVFGRTRLMRLDGDAEVSLHVDSNYYWWQRLRIHVPILTYPEIQFICGDHALNMAMGESWIFDTWKPHNVINPTDRRRIHLVADTVGSSAFWKLAAQAKRPCDPNADNTAFSPRFVAYDPHLKVQLNIETRNFPVVMSPWEQTCLVQELLTDLRQVAKKAPDIVTQIEGYLQRLQRDWRALWAQYGDDEAGWPFYREILEQLKRDITPFENSLKLPNHSDVAGMIKQILVKPAMMPALAKNKVPATPKTPSVQNQQPQSIPEFDRPIFIVCAPRSGSTLLFETLLRSPSVWTVGGESHGIFEKIAKLNPSQRGFDSNRLTEADADPQTIGILKARFLNHLQDRQGQPLPPTTAKVRMLEKTPKNALRIPFLNAVFPDALFIYLHREPRDNINSILEAWKSGKFVTYPQLPNWEGNPWSLLLIPGWEQLKGQPLEQIAAAQWNVTNQTILSDLEQLPRRRWCSLTYEDLIADTPGQIKRLCQFAEIEWDQDLTAPLPLSRHTLTPPDPNKWQKNAAVLETVLPSVEPVINQVKTMTQSSEKMPNGGANGGAAVPSLNPLQISLKHKRVNAEGESIEPEKLSPLRSIYTSNFPDILKQLNISLIVSTYQAGKLIAVRADGNDLNTHFRLFPKPMGVAANQGRLAVGTQSQIWELRNMPAVTRKLEQPEKHDACYLPRDIHVTGDIDIHEMAYGGNDLWFINTRFSCLCTLERGYSFVPRWQPKFISVLDHVDRCHLNGIGIVNEKPKYATALGETDSEMGWRETKATGGILMDVESNEVIKRGLSMPHSPRWYQDQLWVLESGNGSLATFDLKTGELHTVALLPGFTRGLDFWGNLAFIGLSQVRETAAFSGIPITERLEERISGVWVVNIKTGDIVAFLKFEDAVQEIFAVQVLPSRFPEIIDWDEKIIGGSYVVPDEALARVPKALIK